MSDIQLALLSFIIGVGITYLVLMVKSDKNEWVD